MSVTRVPAALRRMVEERAQQRCPRTQPWHDHFVLHGVTIGGLSAEGRTTTQLLQMNTAERVWERARLVAAGLVSS